MELHCDPELLSQVPIARSNPFPTTLRTQPPQTIMQDRVVRNGFLQANMPNAEVIVFAALSVRGLGLGVTHPLSRSRPR